VRELKPLACLSLSPDMNVGVIESPLKDVGNREP
jgi:hypothetical protein